MDRAVELELVDELLSLKEGKGAYLDDAVGHNPVAHYTSEQRFSEEREHIFSVVPTAAAHVSEMPSPGDFLRREIAGQPVLLTRDKEGKANAFLNVCRHRGTRLVDAKKGCQHRFSCPYHAWPYSSVGDLIAAPHFKTGFTGHDKSTLGLKRLDCQERFGFVWVTLNPDASHPVEDHFRGLSADLDALQLDDLVIAHQDTHTRHANWKILVEGGIEAYHFKIAHRSTIGPHFEDNLSSYQRFGSHIRSILPRTSLSTLPKAEQGNWRLRDHAQILYTLFPSTQLLVQQDHVVWLTEEPVSPDQTRLRLSTLVPKHAADQGDHWAQNHHITLTTLDEDFVIGESIQSTLSSGANEDMLFGRFEGALNVFNQTIAAHLPTSG